MIVNDLITIAGFARGNEGFARGRMNEDHVRTSQAQTLHVWHAAYMPLYAFIDP